MKFLFCCEFYYPSVGGVQEVMKQIAERLVARGHEVTVATTALPNRDFTSLNGVQIAQFRVSGNLVRGMHGDIEGYRQFVRNFECDAILIKAAQQWTFDALWPDLDEIKVRKVFIPCGFLSLYQEEYRNYFENITSILCKFDCLIFYSNDYRDINFARERGIKNFIVLSNGASEEEFNISVDLTFRERYNIPENSFVILSVGSFSGAKGHLEIAQALVLLDSISANITLVLNGNNPFIGADSINERKNSSNLFSLYLSKSKNYFKILGDVIVRPIKVFRYFAKNPFDPIRALNEIKDKLAIIAESKMTPYERIRHQALKINSEKLNRKVLLLDLPRSELIQAYLAADLFVFASHVEYSPLVLYEAAAAGLPFLTSRAGNAEEIVEWLGGGFLMKDSSDSEGFRIIDPGILASEIHELIKHKDMLQEVGKTLKKNWEMGYTWKKITDDYEMCLSNKNN